MYKDNPYMYEDNPYIYDDMADIHKWYTVYAGGYIRYVQ